MKDTEISIGDIIFSKWGNIGRVKDITEQKYKYVGKEPQTVPCYLCCKLTKKFKQDRKTRLVYIFHHDVSKVIKASQRLNSNTL